MTDDEHIAKFYPIFLLKDSRRVQLEICKIFVRVFSLLSVEKIKDTSRTCFTLKAGDKYILDLRFKKTYLNLWFSVFAVYSHDNWLMFRFTSSSVYIYK